ncbi:MAG: isoprenylcysteine carboxylmethyltransferase family protein [Candidatus Hydrogenedentes bacterium]|nr:isoprenylcysteine carboxylmethyltransferase family protein [Candidatus Hydrogenedentota bacterium]
MGRTVSRAVFGTVVFTFLVPCTVAGVVPYFLVTGSQLFTFRSALTQISGVVLFASGVLIYAWCAYDFATFGRGTPSPTHPPQELVVRGLYRFSRNPMYVGVSSVVFGEALFFGSGNQLVYACCVLAGFHARVITGEEQALRRVFGASYEAYCSRVPRWIGFVKKGERHED